MKRALSRKNLWDKLPRGIKSVVGSALQYVPLEYLIGRQFKITLRFLEDAQWWPIERSRDYQLVELRRICKIAYERTSFYRRSFDAAGFHPQDLGKVEDIRLLPTIDRATIRENLADMLASSIKSTGIDYISTNGTSGEPLRFYIGSDRHPVEFAYIAASWRRVGFTPGATLAVLKGKLVPPDRTGLRHEYDPALNHHYYSSFHLTEENMHRYLEHIANIGPCYLHVNPSTVAILAQFARISGRELPHNVLGVIAESEIVYESQRELVETVFGCKYFSCYGHTEKLIAASECELSKNYHIWPTYGYFELLDSHGKPVDTSGQYGEIVGTGFINSVVPFIRYRTGDYAMYVGDRCSHCNREHTLISKIKGHRIQEVLVAKDGSLITHSLVTSRHDDTFDHILRFQFFQDTPGYATLRLVPMNGFMAMDVEKITENIHKILVGRIEFDVKIVESIPLSGNAKFIYVDQRIPGIRIDMGI